MNDFKKRAAEEIENFRADGHKFLNEEISVAEFKGKSGGMGAYAQKDRKKFMVRLRMPSGIMNKKMLDLVYGYAQKYALNYIHLTTRQAIQLHDLDIDPVCDIMLDCLDNDLYLRGGGGNYPRNVALSPLSGVDVDEAFDPSCYACAVNKYFMERMADYNLPRKFKAAFSNNLKDTANAAVTDMGFIPVIKDNKKYFNVFLAGGLGFGSAVGIKYPKLAPAEEVLYYIEAMMRVFIEKGNYKQRAKARTRFIPIEMGKDEFLSFFDKTLEEVKKECDFPLIEYTEGKAVSSDCGSDIKPNNRIINQKQKGLYSLIVHPRGGILSVDGLKKIIDFTKEIENVDFRLSMNEEIYVRNLNSKQVSELYNITSDFSEETMLNMSVSCIGTPKCQIGIQKSQELLNNIISYFKEKNFTDDILPSLFISGCGNSCSRHSICPLGFAGKPVKTDSGFADGFEVFAGGSHKNDNIALGEKIGILKAEDIPEFLYKIAVSCKEKNISFEKYLSENLSDIKDLIISYQ